MAATKFSNYFGLKHFKKAKEKTFQPFKVGIGLKVLSTYHTDCQNVWFGWPVYEVKCLCSRGQK
jgi:hypothetical protein